MAGKSLRRNPGFSLIEVLIAIAIIAIIAAIAIPAYQSYAREARLGVARNNIEGLRIHLEDWRLDNGTYQVQGANFDPKAVAEGGAVPGWEWTPDGDNDLYTYAVTAGADTYDVLVESADDPNEWVRCEDRMNNCCDSTTAGAAKGACN